MSSKHNVIKGYIEPLRDMVLAIDLEYGAQVINGNIIPNDNMEARGIKPRWCKVFRVGPDVKDLKSGDWILQEHARWSTGFYINEGGENILVRWIDYTDTMLVTDEKPAGFTATL